MIVSGVVLAADDHMQYRPGSWVSDRQILGSVSNIAWPWPPPPQIVAAPNSNCLSRISICQRDQHTKSRGGQWVAEGDCTTIDVH